MDGRADDDARDQRRPAVAIEGEDLARLLHLDPGPRIGMGRCAQALEIDADLAGPIGSRQVEGRHGRRAHMPVDEQPVAALEAVHRRLEPGVEESGSSVRSAASPPSAARRRRRSEPRAPGRPGANSCRAAGFPSRRVAADGLIAGQRAAQAIIIGRIRRHRLERRGGPAGTLEAGDRGDGIEERRRQRPERSRSRRISTRPRARAAA